MMDGLFCRGCGKRLSVESNRRAYCSNECRIEAYCRDGKELRRRRKEQQRAKRQTLSCVNELARACGMTYGQYVATHMNGG